MSSVLITYNGQVDSTDITTVVLNEEQIEQLLQRAEARLRQKAGSDVEPDSNVLDLTPHIPAEKAQIKVPRLHHNAQTSTYIKEHGGVAKTVTTALVSREQHKMADGLRQVLTKEQIESKRVVCVDPCKIVYGSYEEILSQFTLDADQLLILSMPCFRERIIKIIVTLTLQSTAQLSRSRSEECG